MKGSPFFEFLSDRLGFFAPRARDMQPGFASSTSGLSSFPPRAGLFALGARLFGWSMLAVLAAFLSDNFLDIGYGLPSLAATIAGGVTFIDSLPILGVYGLAIALAAVYVFKSPNRTMREDSIRIHGFNLYVVRGLFWSVLLIGIVDAGISFIRIEDLVDAWMGEGAARLLGRSAFVGPWIHIPLLIIGFIVALFVRSPGFHWLALLIVIAETGIVISRFVFSYEQAFMGDLVRYWYAALFLFASAYTLHEEGHVRVDVFFAGLTQRRKSLVNALGSVFLGMSTAWTILIVGLAGKNSMINAPALTFEVSQSGNAGMFVKYQLAAFIGLFAATMLIQFVSYFLAAMADLGNEPGNEPGGDPDEHAKRALS
ncbi:TRAP transporter small permease subunit [Thioalkalivibrio sp. HK1]|uniref:TRAP transporter small permease subunit n=1 Tax=Thioalkalivibrio sp. HK1 TaxID=1469245 RepID=UPI0004AFF975|nr:TRAP transporter small permease subunit [Thioalkalivibrio sp. HK1]